MRTATPYLANAARNFVHVAAISLVTAAWGCGDSREGGITGPPQEPAPSAPAARIEIAPGALLLTQTGAAHKLAVRAFDAQGQPTTAAVTWRSSSPSVSIGPDGTAVATVPVGSATITAETAGGIRSLPIVVIVAQPKQGALLVSDDQVGDLLQVDDPEAFGIGWRYQVALRNVSPPSPGTIVLASGGSVVAGKVVSTAASGSDIVVTLEFVPLTELFEALEFSFELPFINEDVPMTGTAALDPRSVPARPTLVEPVGPSFDEVEMEFGPIKCKATAAIPLSLQNTTGSYSGNISGIVQFSFTDGIRLGVTGGISGQMTARPIVEGEWTGGVKCEWNIPTSPWTLPIGGPLAWFYGLQVATGIGVQMKGALELGQVGFDLTANASAQLQMVYECLPPAWICGLQNSLEPTATGTLKPVLPDLADARVKLSGRGYLYGKLQLGPNRRLLQAASFLSLDKLTIKLAEANAGIEQTLDAAGPQRQATDPAYASSAELHLNAEVGLDVELKLNWEDFATKFGYVMQVADVPLWADTIVLSRSPRGTFAVSPSSVKAGNDTDLGDLVTFTFELDPVTYLSAYSVDKVEILWLQPSGDTLTLANGRPPCTTLTPTATGQAQFSCQVDFLEEHAGKQTFVGFVYPRLYGIPLPVPFEVSADSRSTVDVTVDGCPTSSQTSASGSSLARASLANTECPAGAGVLATNRFSFVQVTAAAEPGLAVENDEQKVDTWDPFEASVEAEVSYESGVATATGTMSSTPALRGDTLFRFEESGQATVTASGYPPPMLADARIGTYVGFSVPSGSVEFTLTVQCKIDLESFVGESTYQLDKMRDQTVVAQVLLFRPNCESGGEETATGNLPEGEYRLRHSASPFAQSSAGNTAGWSNTLIYSFTLTFQ